MKRRIYMLLFVSLLLVEICIALFVHDSFVRPYLGDVLVTVLLCACLRMIVPRGIRLLPLYVFLFAAFVEVGQYFDMVSLLGLSDNRFFSVLLGTTFSFADLVCYGAGCLLFAIGDRFIQKK